MLQSIIQISIGTVLVIGSILVMIRNIVKTPNNLRGFYGKMFLILTILAILGGGVLIAFGVIGLV